MGLKKLILHMVLWFFYQLAKCLPVRQNRITFVTLTSQILTGDFKLLDEELKRYPDIEIRYILTKFEKTIKGDLLYFLNCIKQVFLINTSKVVILNDNNYVVSHFKRSQVRVLQVWHACGAVKKFGNEIDRQYEIKNYDYVLAPSKKTAKFYMEAFGCDNSKIKICSLPRVDDILTDNGCASRFFTENPALSDKKIVLYLPTFRERDAYVAEKLKVEFDELADYHLIISAHPLFSKIKIEDKFSYSGDFSTYDLMKIADVIITDYSACAFEASVLMKPLYFFVPDYEEYSKERGINVNLKEEMPSATFEDAEALVNAIKSNSYDFDMLYKFKSEYVENSKANNAEILAKFISMLIA